MRKFSKRFLTGLLAIAMVFSLSGMTAFAAETDDTSAEPEAVTETVEAEDASAESEAVTEAVEAEETTASVEETEEGDAGIATLSAEDEIATIDDEPYPESEHPYPNQTDETWSYTLAGADEGVYVTFDEQTETEDGYDYIYIYDDADNLIGAYTGTELAAATVYVPTAGFTIELVSDQMANAYGFAVTNVEAAGYPIDLSIYGCATDPISQVFVGDTPTAEVYLNGGYYPLTQDEDFTVSADTSEENAGTTVEVTISGTGNYTGELTTHVYVWDYNHQIWPESDHPYEVNTEKTWEYTVPDATNGLYVTFDERTETEEGYDFIYIYDDEDNLIGAYSGTELAGKTVYVPTATVKIHLSADYVYCYWGFAVTDIEAAGDKLDLGKAGFVDDPLEAVEKNGTVSPEVTFGGKTLEKDKDYTVDADTNTAGEMVEVTINGMDQYEGTLTTHVFVYDDKAITVTDFDIASGEHDDADEELNQTIIVTITFSGDIVMTDDDLSDDLLITIAGENVYDTDRNITYDVQNGNQLVITMVSYDWVAIYGGALEVSDVWQTGLAAADGEGYVYFEEQSGRIPIGIVVNNDMIAATDAEPASTYVDVAHKANMRGMFTYQLVSTDAAGEETVLGSWTSHAHAFYTSITCESIASTIASSINNLDGYSAEYTDGDTFFTMTADSAEEGQTLAIRMDEIKARINTAHAPTEYVAEDGMLITRCSFCGEVFEEEPITYADIPVCQNGEQIATITGEEFAVAQAYAPEQTFTRHTGMGDEEVTAKYVLVKDLLGDYQPDEGCGFAAVAEFDGFTSTYTADIYEDAYFYCEEGTGYYRTAMDGAWGYMWCTDVTYFIVGHNYEDGVCTICGKEQLPESDHPYANGIDETWSYTLDGADEGVYVTFDEQTATESGYDYIYIYDGDGNLVGKYDGTSLAGATVYIPTDTFTIELTSDSAYNDWGFAVTNVEAAEYPIDLGVYGYVADPSMSVYVNETPTPKVLLNGSDSSLALVQDEDFTVSANTGTAGETVEVTIIGTGKYTGTLTTHVYVYDDDHLLEPAAVNEDTMTNLRQSSDEGTSRVTLKDVDDAYRVNITSVTLKPVETDKLVSEGGTVTGPTTSAETGGLEYPEAPKDITLKADELKISGNNLTFNRTEDDPIVYVTEGHGYPYITETYRNGELYRRPVYNQTQVYEVTVEAAGYKDAVGLATYYTGTSAGFSIIEDTDGNRFTTDDQTIVKTWTSDEIREMASFANGSSQCGMTGFRTFTTNGVSLVDLLEDAGATVSPDDSFLLQTSDDYGNTFSYSDLFGATRYFMSGIYDPEFVDIYNQAENDADSGGNDLIRRWLANYALEHESTIEPRICVDYREDLIYGSDIRAGVELPTAQNTTFNSLVSFENQYRFVYGIEIEQEPVTVTFDTQGGSDVNSQTVLTHPMTSTANTTMRSSYWGTSLIIYRGQGDGIEKPEQPEGADTIAVPATPTKDGYVFGGWYTDEDCTDGNEFDFEANDGTVDENTTLYAKWIPQSEAVGIIDFDITSAEHDDADEELNQTIIATITFSEDIELAHSDLRDDLLITIAGGDVYDTDRTITYEVQNGNQLVITMVSTGWVAITSGMLQIQDLTGEGIVAADSSKYVVFPTQSGRIPTGIVVNNDMIAGTDTEPASTYVNVAHKANMRGQYAYELVSIDADGNETVLGNGTSHAHDFYGAIDEAAIASAIAGTFSEIAGYTVEYTEGDTYFIITADNAVEGEQLAVRMVEWKATINEAHAPSATRVEDGMVITYCPFCGEILNVESVEKASLEAAIAAAENLDASNYTDDSWQDLQDALDAAKAVAQDDTATNDDIMAAELDLLNAMAALKPAEEPQPDIDKDVLEAAISAADALNDYKDYYTDDSWNDLQSALDAAKTVFADPDATQADVNGATVDLVNALANLQPANESDTGGSTKNGLYKIIGGELWGYYVNNEVDTSYTGFASNQYGDWYVVNGYIHFDQNTVAKDKTGKNGDKGVGAAGTWYYVLGNKVQYGFTGLANYKNQYGWWYIKDGVVDFTHNGVDKNKNGWWYVKNGKVEFGHNGVDKNQYGWWYITDGKVQFSFTGLANYKNQYGWWYIKEGKVNFSYNGKASNRYGTWNVVNGKVVF